jgi:hypothetical protein
MTELQASIFLILSERRNKVSAKDMKEGKLRSDLQR